MERIVKFLLAVTLKHSKLDVQIFASDVIQKAKPEHVHTLNGSGLGNWPYSRCHFRKLPTGRWNSVIIPEVLRPYMGNTEVIKP